MRGIFLLVVAAVVLVAAGVITISWGDGTATVKINKEKARERSEQVLEEARAIGSALEKK